MRYPVLLLALTCSGIVMPEAEALGLGEATTARSGSSSPASGRSAGKDLGPVRNDAVAVELRMSSVATRGRAWRVESRTRTAEVQWRAGDRVELCFKASADGYVTVWYHDMGKTPELLYPNEHSHRNNERAEPVIGGREYCIGGGNGFGLRVEGSKNVQKVFVHWTKALEDAVPRTARLALVPGEEEVTQTQAVAELIYRAPTE